MLWARCVIPSILKMALTGPMSIAVLTADGTFEVCLGTFRDRRNAFQFAIDALGRQRDGLAGGTFEINPVVDHRYAAARENDGDGA